MDGVLSYMELYWAPPPPTTTTTTTKTQSWREAEQWSARSMQWRSRSGRQSRNTARVEQTKPKPTSRMPNSILFPDLLPFGRSCYCSALCFLFLFFSQIFLRFLLQHSAQTTHFLEKEDFLPPTASSLHSGDR